jgi:hypothetical protein
VSEALATFLDLLFAGEPDGSFAEIRFKLRNGGMGQDFVAVRDRERLARLIQARGAKTDLFVGVAPRSRQEGTRAAVERVHVLWADLDTPESIEALKHFEPAPSMVIGSGSGQHGYWSLSPPVGPDEAERANRRLAHALGADMAATDGARILRPPATHNHKTGEPVPVEIDYLAFEVYALEDVVGELADPVAERPPRRLQAVETFKGSTDDPLLTLPPAVYVEALTGQVVGRDGKVRCPLHDDGTPSLHVYNSAEAGWACFGCEAPPGKVALGGDIYAFAARLYGLEPRGRGFHEIRKRLEADLLGAVA